MGLETLLIAGALLTATPDTVQPEMSTQEILTYVLEHGENITYNENLDLGFLNEERGQTQVFRQCKGFAVKGEHGSLNIAGCLEETTELDPSTYKKNPSLVYHRKFRQGWVMGFDIGAKGDGQYCIISDIEGTETQHRICDELIKDAQAFEPKKIIQKKKPYMRNT